MTFFISVILIINILNFEEQVTFLKCNILQKTYRQLFYHVGVYTGLILQQKCLLSSCTDSEKVNSFEKKKVLSPNIKELNRKIQANMKKQEEGTFQTLRYQQDSGEGECQTETVFGFFFSPLHDMPQRHHDLGKNY